MSLTALRRREPEERGSHDGTARATRRTEGSPGRRNGKKAYDRTPAERFSDWITAIASSGPVLIGHVIWFAVWVVINVGWVPGVPPFDPFPFSFLTMAVSLEAIFLALFVLASQNRLGRESEKRGHLDLQIDLLAEREMTVVLRLLQDIASHLQVKETVTPEQIRDLIKKTDIQSLTERMEELAGEPVKKHST